MKKSFFGILFGAIFTTSLLSFNDNSSAQGAFISDQQSWDFTICGKVGGPYLTGCNFPAIAGPCWRSELCH